MSFLMSKRYGKRRVMVEALGDSTTPAAVPTTTGTTSTPAASSPFSLHDALSSDNVSTAAAVALVYHGFKRTGSVIWALIYGLAGKEFPIEAVPIALAQGFGKRKECRP